MNLSWVVWLTWLRDVKPSKGTWTNLRSGTWQFYDVQQGQGPVPGSEWTLLLTQVGEWARREQLCWEGLGTVSGLNTGHDSAMQAWSPESQLSLGLHQKQGGQHFEGGILPLPSALVGPHLQCCILLWILSTGETWTCWRGSRQGPWRWSEGWSISPMRTGWKALEKGRRLSISLSVPKRSCEKDGDGFFSMAFVIGQKDKRV